MISSRKSVVFAALIQVTFAFLTPVSRHSFEKQPSIFITSLRATAHEDNTKDGQGLHGIAISTLLACSVAMSSVNPLPAQAYVSSDYASETVKAAVQSLKDASGNVDATFKAYENIAGIITEGKGVGGMVNYSKFPCSFVHSTS